MVAIVLGYHAKIARASEVVSPVHTFAIWFGDSNPENRKKASQNDDK